MFKITKVLITSAYKAKGWLTINFWRNYLRELF